MGAGFKAVPTGIAHGTVTVIVDGRPFEVTTLRQDVETYGRHAKVEFGRDWAGDAHRRDFTINALSVAADGTIHDYTGGLADLAARRVRFIGEAKTRIEEDYLRILRFFRFHAAYGQGELDRAGLRACIEARAGLDQLSRERVRMEMMKLLLAGRATPTLAVMGETGLLLRVLGGVPYLAAFEMMSKVEAAASVAPDAARRLGALGVATPEDAERLWQRLRLTNAERARIDAMAVEWRRLSPAHGERAARAALYRLDPEHYVDCALLAWARARASAHDQTWRDFATLPQRWTAPVFPLKAADFIARGIEKGPALGAALRAAEAAWIDEDFPMGDDAVQRIMSAAAAMPPTG
jgi:tRNA nucleotidyltransferase/poly(A) polymerase